MKPLAGADLTQVRVHGSLAYLAPAPEAEQLLNRRAMDRS